jgi:hypothetical protein
LMITFSDQINKHQPPHRKPRTGMRHSPGLLNLDVK